MSGFSEREEVEEKRFARNEELLFMARARRSKLFGLWIAKKLGLAKKPALDYASEFVEIDLDDPYSKLIIDRARVDLDGNNVDYSVRQLNNKLTELEQYAIDKIKSGD